MQIGDLVTWVDDDVVGIIIRQMGMADKWWVQWIDGKVCWSCGCNLELLCK